MGSVGRNSLIALSSIGLVVVFAAQLAEIRKTMPYPQHGDERTLLLGAQRILESGDWDPKTYEYPSLPVYLTTFCLAAGVISKSGQGPGPLAVRHVGRVVGPYYDQPAVIAVARKVWVVIGSLCMFACALIALRLAGPWAMLLSVSFLAGGETLRGLSASYLNVDILMCSFGCFTLAWLVYAAHGALRSQSVIAAGLLCGATTACKYTGCVVLIPCLLWIWLYLDRKGVRSLQLLACSALTFLFCCPYFLFRFPQFVDALAFENYHYRVRGHSGFDVEPGWSQVAAYLDNLRQVYGWGSLGAALLGSLQLLRRTPKLGSVILSLPIASLALLSSYKVHFVRNAILLYAILPVLAAVGLVAVWRELTQWSARWLERWPGRHRRLGIELGCAGILLAIVLATLPIDRAIASYREPTDSRNRFARWAAHHLFTPTALLVPTSLPVSSAGLPSHVQLVPLDLSNEAETRAHAGPGNYMLKPIWNTGKRRSAKRLQALQPGLAALPPHRRLAHFDGTPAIPVQGEELSVNPAFDIVVFTE